MVRLIVHIEKAEVLKAIADGIIARPDVTGVIDASTVFISVHEQTDFVHEISNRVTDAVNTNRDILDAAINDTVSVAIDKVLQGDSKILLWGQSAEDVKTVPGGPDIDTLDSIESDLDRQSEVTKALVKHFENAAGDLASGIHDATLGELRDVIHKAAKLIPSDMIDVASIMFENAQEDFVDTLETEILQAVRIALEASIDMYCDMAFNQEDLHESENRCLIVAELTEYFQEACENLEGPRTVDFDYLNAAMWDIIDAASKLIPNDMQHDRESLLDEAAGSLDSKSDVVRTLLRRIGMYCDKDNLNQ